jgi:hypothetical protein
MTPVGIVPIVSRRGLYGKKFEIGEGQEGDPHLKTQALARNNREIGMDSSVTASLYFTRISTK